MKLKGDITLNQIADMLWKRMNIEIERNGYSDLTLALEGAARDIWDIIKVNEIE